MACTWRIFSSSPSTAPGGWAGPCSGPWPPGRSSGAALASSGPCSTGTNRPSTSTARSGAVADDEWTTFRLSGEALVGRRRPACGAGTRRQEGAGPGRTGAAWGGAWACSARQPLHSCDHRTRASGGTDAHHNDCSRQACSRRYCRLVARRSRGWGRRSAGTRQRQPHQGPGQVRLRHPDGHGRHLPAERVRRPDGTTSSAWTPTWPTPSARPWASRPSWSNATFDTIIPGIVAGKYDMGDSSFTDTKAREKVGRLRRLLQRRRGFYVKADSHDGFNGLKALCGHSVAVETRHHRADRRPEPSAKCTATGKGQRPQLPHQNQANLAVSDGRADVGFADSRWRPTSCHLSNGVSSRTAGTPFETRPLRLRPAQEQRPGRTVAGGGQALMANGQSTSRSSTKWGVQAGAVTTATVNGATS